MNKNLMVAIILLSMIPGFAAIGTAISGMLVNDTSAAANVPSAGGFIIFFVGASLLLIMTILYLMNLYHSDNKNELSKTNKKVASPNIKTQKSTMNAVHIAEKKVSKLSVTHNSHMHSNMHSSNKNNIYVGLNALTHRIKFAQISNEKTEQYIVFVVALVAVVGILIIILR